VLEDNVVMLGTITEQEYHKMHQHAERAEGGRMVQEKQRIKLM
jgi:hypothetical protein